MRPADIPQPWTKLEVVMFKGKSVLARSREKNLGSLCDIQSFVHSGAHCHENATLIFLVREHLKLRNVFDAGLFLTEFCNVCWCFEQRERRVMKFLLRQRVACASIVVFFVGTSSCGTLLDTTSMTLGTNLALFIQLAALCSSVGKCENCGCGQRLTCMLI